MEKIALITGCSSGIGMLSAIEMARGGFRVVATMRDPGKSERLLQSAAEAGAKEKIDVRRIDITETASLPGIVSEIVKDYGRIDVLVNNAGYALGGFAEDVQLEELRQQLDTNFFGHVATTKAVLPVMRAQHAGHIIMVSSIAGLVANPVTSSYAASKFALEGWSESLRMEVHSLGIKVVLVEPGAFATDIWEKNARVAKSAMAGESPNLDRARRFVNIIRNRVKKDDATKVARLIRKAAEDPNPRLRYRIGKDAHLGYWFKRILPWRSYEKLVIKMTDIG